MYSNTKTQIMNTTIFAQEVLRLADSMAASAANMSGMGYDQLIHSREELKDLIKAL